jgi:hypothetical protein
MLLAEGSYEAWHSILIPFNPLVQGGLSCEWSEDHVKELLSPFGTLKSFNLVMDKDSGKSKVWVGEAWEIARLS